MSEHSAHVTSLPFGFRTWLWRYTCLLLLISMLWHRQAIFESKGDKLSSSAESRIRTQGLRYLFTSRLNTCLLLLISMLWHRQAIFDSNDMPEAALDNWQSVCNAQVSISTPVCVNFELRPGAGDIHICWFNFDALAQENAYKPAKEPINYREPGGNRTHDIQTEANPPAASCPARTLHATEIASKNATPMTCPRLHWTTDNPSGMHRCQFQHLCVLILNYALALAIYIFVGLILMLWRRETHINPQRNR